MAGDVFGREVIEPEAEPALGGSVGVEETEVLNYGVAEPVDGLPVATGESPSRGPVQECTVDGSALLVDAAAAAWMYCSANLFEKRYVADQTEPITSAIEDNRLARLQITTRDTSCTRQHRFEAASDDCALGVPDRRTQVLAEGHRFLRHRSCYSRSCG